MNTVAEIWRYPVKSVGGERVDTAHANLLGIIGDRAWGLRDLDTGKILSGKTPAVGRALLNLRSYYCEEPDETGTIPDATVSFGSSEYSTTQPDSLSAAFSDLLGRNVRFERATTTEETYESYWPELPDMALSDVTTDFPIAMFTNKGTFVDLGALHLVTTSALLTLQSHLPASELDIRRFRPNIVIATPEDGFIDNEWAGRTATIGEATIAFSLAAPRCVMTTLGQGNLDRDPGILQTLARFNKIGFDGFGNFACLGVYAEVTHPGTIRVNDELRLES
jgi:uncharacterized protein